MVSKQERRAPVQARIVMITGGTSLLGKAIVSDSCDSHYDVRSIVACSLGADVERMWRWQGRFRARQTR
jgi:hypothetical protein